MFRMQAIMGIHVEAVRLQNMYPWLFLKGKQNKTKNIEVTISWMETLLKWKFILIWNASNRVF